MVTSTWGTPNMVKDGVNPELLLGGKYGNTLHVWDLRAPAPPAGAQARRRAADAARASSGTRSDARLWVRRRRLSLKDLSSSIWLWYRDPHKKRPNGSDGPWAIKKVIEIPAEPADPEKLPPILQGFKAVGAARDRHQSVD